MLGRSFGIIGLGNFGSTIATDLERFGDYVIGIDIDKQRVSRHVDQLSQALIVDATDEEALREAGVGECDVALVAIGEDLEASLLAAVNCKLVGAGEVWAKAFSRTHHRILSRIGVDRVIHPEVEIGQRIAQVLHNPLVRDYVSLGNGYHVVRFRMPESLEGKALSELAHTEEHELRCVGVMRGTEFIGRDGMDCELAADDLLLLLGKRDDLRDFAAKL
ncbi:potassium channel family protein [Roseovarius aestuariivivens]|uniref:potassium channel family protein n=1 Tax=Roseovarius aestuariivivens TaxID=1888910 RepID=UPI0010811F1C|nr:TrkA family potassium uptake protein [Roseovarius aestuariivivens]